jgi:hypothetical protein
LFLHEIKVELILLSLFFVIKVNRKLYIVIKYNLVYYFYIFVYKLYSNLYSTVFIFNEFKSIEYYISRNKSYLKYICSFIWIFLYFKDIYKKFKKYIFIFKIIIITISNIWTIANKAGSLYEYIYCDISLNNCLNNFLIKKVHKIKI